VVVGVLLTGCSDGALVGRNGEAEQQAICGTVPADSYAPPVLGARWTYQTSEDGVPRPEKIVVLEENLSDGVSRYSFEGEQRGFRWIRDDGASLGVVRIVHVDPVSAEPISDQYFDPPAPRFDYSRVILGETWTAPSYTRTVVRISLCPTWQQARGSDSLSLCPDALVVETIDDEIWTVTGVDREVTVPAGTFPALCHTRRCTTSCRENEFCFAQGIGKLTETGDGQRDELASVCFPDSGG
jgi:hypothetical protein